MITTVQQTINILNDALQKDQRAIQNLISTRTECNEQLAQHPSIQVKEDKNGQCAVGLLGIINGIFKTKVGTIQAVFDEQGKLEKFIPAPNTNQQTTELNVFDVAKYILENTEPMTTLKLQKLCYYAQAWSLVRDEEPLFHETIEAWSDGPVCLALYEYHNHIDDMPGDSKKLDDKQRKTIDAVIKRYGHLVDLTQIVRCEKPWAEARKQWLNTGEGADKVITHDSLNEYFTPLLYDKPQDEKKDNTNAEGPEIPPTDYYI